MHVRERNSKRKIETSMNVYYVNSVMHQSDDVLKAVKKAMQIKVADANITTLTLLIPTNESKPLLDPLKIGKQYLDNNGFMLDDLCVQIRTVKTYQPEYVREGKKPSEILVPLRVWPNDLYQFEDMNDIGYWVVLPTTLDIHKSFLSIHEAKDCETGIPFPAPNPIDFRVANAIDYLKGSPSQGDKFMHPLDEDELKYVAVTLRKLKVNIDYDAAVHYGLEIGLKPSTARKIADVFMRAQSHSMQIKYPHVDIKKMLNKPRE